MRNGPLHEALSRSLAVELLFHAGITAPAASRELPGRATFLQWLVGTLRLSPQQRAFLRVSADNGRRVLEDLVRRLVSRHRTVLQRAAAGEREGPPLPEDQPAGDLRRGLDTLFAAGFSIGAALTDVLGGEGVLRLSALAGSDAALQWLGPLLRLAVGPGPRTGTNWSRGGAAEPSSLGLPATVVELAQRQLVTLGPYEREPFASLPEAALWLTDGMLSIASGPAPCTLHALLALFLLAPGVLDPGGPGMAGPAEAAAALLVGRKEDDR